MPKLNLDIDGFHIAALDNVLAMLLSANESDFRLLPAQLLDICDF